MRIIDVASAAPTELKAALAGVDYIVSGVASEVLEIQRPLFRAAKEAGVKRIIPSDFGTACPPGVRNLHDKVGPHIPIVPRLALTSRCRAQKLAIRDYIQNLGIPYTFVEIGWWTQLVFPTPPSVQVTPLMDTCVVYGTGSRKCAVTNIANVGGYVARILQDERTINQTVFVWEHEINTDEIWDIVQRTAEDSAAIVAKKSHVSEPVLSPRLFKVDLVFLDR